jgi:hypothetical protein
MVFSKNVNATGWEPVNSYKDMTFLSSTNFSIIFLGFIPIHYFFVFLIMYKYSAKLKPLTERMSEKFFHLSTQLICPSNYKDWDEIEDGRFDTNWKNVYNEMKALLALFAIENILLCVPMFILLHSINERNKTLETTSVNFTNILRATFLYKSVLRSFSLLTV